MEFKISDVIAKFKSGDLKGVDDKLVKYIEKETAGKGVKANELEENELQTFLNAIDTSHSGTISEKELNEFLGANSEGKEVKASIDKVLSESKIPSEEEKTSSIDGKPGVKKEENKEGDDKYYVEVQKWKSTPLEGNQKANDCLWDIWTNYFKGEVSWETFKTEVMKVNPQIYGTTEDSSVDDKGNKIKRGSRTGEVLERWIYDGEKIYLPVNLLKKVDKADKEDKVDKPKDDNNDQKIKIEKGSDGTVEVTENKDGTVSRVYKNTSDTKVKTEMLDSKGRQIKETQFDSDGKTERKIIETEYKADGSRIVKITEPCEGNGKKITVREIDKNGVIQSEKVDGEETIKSGKAVNSNDRLSDANRTKVQKEIKLAYERVADIINTMAEIRAELKRAKTKADLDKLMGKAGDLLNISKTLAGDLNSTLSNWNSWSQYEDSPELKSYREIMLNYFEQTVMRNREIYSGIMKEIEVKIDKLPKDA